MASQDTYVCSLSEAMLKKAEDELRETPDRRRQALINFKKTVQDYPGLNCPTDDRFLLKFLRARKFDETRSLDLLTKYFRVRKEYTDVFTNFRPSAVKVVLDAGITAVLPGRDDHGRKIIYFRPGKWNPDDCNFYDLFRTNLMSLHSLIEDEETQVNGVQLLMDASGFGLRQASYVSPTYAKTVMNIIQDAFPARMKGIHYVNEPSAIGYIFSMVRPFMKEKLASRLNFHGQSYESLHEHIPVRMLPEELGGEIKEFSSEEWKNALLASENKFIDFEQYELVEDTPGMKGTSVKGDAMEAMSGTFKKLNVD